LKVYRFESFKIASFKPCNFPAFKLLVSDDGEYIALAQDQVFLVELLDLGA
jgi:hypothetical protein